jgi:predicted DNA binding CopG/RHH family protein
MKKTKLTKYEQNIEDHIEEYVPVSKDKFNAIVKSLESRKKDAVLNIRINRGDLDNLKAKAKRSGIKYQTLITEILHKVALS